MQHRRTHTLFTRRLFTHKLLTPKLLAVASLSLLISCSHLAFTRTTPSSTAQAQRSSAPQLAQRLAQSAPSDMTLTNLESILEAEGGDVQGSDGQWQITIEGRTLLVLADTSSNRMRIFTPITSVEDLSPQQIQSILLANFHTALDARYALSENVLVSVFIHPLNSLNEVDLRSALSQVATLANTFGDSYTSGVVGFGPSGPANSSSPDQLAI